MTPVDWPALKSAAVEAARNAYVPYSGFHVGAAGLTEDGRIVTGCNVENASYGLTFCAEVSMIADLRRIGAPKLVAVACMIDDGRPATPCGRCRQILLEHGGPGLLVDGDGTVRTMDELLPGGFVPHDMEGRTHT